MPIAECRLRKLNDEFYEYTPKRGVTFTLTATQLGAPSGGTHTPAKTHLTSFHGAYAPHEWVKSVFGIALLARQASADREKRAIIIKAEGDKEAAKNLAEAAFTMTSSPGAMQLRTLQTLDGLGSSQSNTVILAVPIEVLELAQRFSKNRFELRVRLNEILTSLRRKRCYQPQNEKCIRRRGGGPALCVPGGPKHRTG